MPTAGDASISYEGDVQEIEIVTQEAHVPASVYCEENDDSGCSDTAAGRSRTRYDMLSIVAALAFVLRRPRRRRHRQRFCELFAVLRATL